MKTKHLLTLVLIIAAFSSCSSAFRTGQTPDDVYYSPAPPPPIEYIRTDNQQDKDKYAYNNTYNSEDLAIRRGINDPRYRSNISLDFGYGYNPYGYGYNPYDYYGSSLYGPYSSYYNPYAHTGITFYPYNYNYYSYYSPFNNYYYPSVYFSKYGSPVSNYTGPRTYNLGAYNNNNNVNTNANRAYNHPAQPTTNNSAPVRTFPTQPANRSGVGNFIRRVFTPSDNTRSYSNDNSSNNNSINNNSSPTRTIQTNTSGSSSSSSSSSSGSSSAPVRTFRK
jgi:hypothetical protein